MHLNKEHKQPMGHNKKNMCLEKEQIRVNWEQFGTIQIKYGKNI